MTLRVSKWQPVPDIDSPFDSISYSFQDDKLTVRMVGIRVLVLHFTGVVALRFEQECPGFDFLPVSLLPMLRPSQTFPLLLVEGSSWLEQFSQIYSGNRGVSHFALVSSDHLVQVLARPDVEAKWE
jgi:hypothetical protein